MQTLKIAGILWFISDNLCINIKAVLEIHDELAAQIANSTEEVEYIDGVSSIEEEDEDDGSETKSQIESLQNDPKDKEKGKKDGEKEEEEEVQVDTFRVIGIRRIHGQCLVSCV